ncbi:hypothetical protein RJ639_000772 [Escallonia herrerae]|uniref:Uncharacterized protein n=1 Tax=Escallonia herrerae TaxID=1293975 RepID=A0AA88XAI8_9ASTE|nr:hypothetical protein RJ639_000772 [Escallonia herrerae]
MKQSSKAPIHHHFPDLIQLGMLNYLRSAYGQHEVALARSAHEVNKENGLLLVLPQFSPEGLVYQGEFQQIHSPHSRDLRKLRNHKNPTEVQEDDTTK